MNEDSALARLLDTMLDLPAAERERWIEALPETHSGLKPRLRSLLARAARLETSDFLQSLPRIDDDASGAGQLVGPYRLIRPIGHGGMGAVWLAERDDGMPRRAVALKFLRSASAHDPPFVERLQRERDILASLEHPAIARLYDAGVSGDGSPWLVLEYIDGQHIDDYCRSHDLDVRARVELVLQVARAMSHAHGKLVVHRDLKPSNVLVSTDGQVHVLDFGIAKLLEEGRAEETRLTQLAGRALTPEYASPEQILGKPVTAASDVYSLGVMLYELLAKARPYALKRESRGALEDAIVEADPPRPSERATDPRDARALRGDLDAIVLKALKKAPRERYSSMDAFGEDLSRYLQGRPVLAQPDGRGYRFRKFIARNRLASASVGAILLAILAGAGIALWQAREARTEQRRAEQVKDFIASIFSDANPWIGSQGSPSAAQLLERARARVEAQAGLDPRTRLELLLVLGESFEGIGAVDEADRISAPLVERSVAELGADDPLTLRARSLRAQVHRDRSRTDAMRREMEVVLDSLGAQRERRSVETVRALKLLGEAQMDQAQYADAERTARQALALMARHDGAWKPRDRDAELAGLWELVGTAHEALVDYGPALEALERAQAHVQSAHRDQPLHPSVIDMRLLWARVAAHVDLPRAIASMQQSIQDTAEVFGAEHRSVGLYLQNLAVWQARAGDLDGAAQSIGRALPILERSFGVDGLHVAAALDAAGYIALNAREPARAIASYDRALGIAAKHLPPDGEHATVMRMRRSLARAYAGEPEAAVAELRHIVDAFRTSKFNAPSRAWLALGEAQRLTGRYRDALATQQAGLALVSDGPAAERERMAFLAEIGLDHVGLREYDAALPALQRAMTLIDKHQTHSTPLRAEVAAGLSAAQAAAERAAPQRLAPPYRNGS